VKLEVVVIASALDNT